MEIVEKDNKKIMIVKYKDKPNYSEIQAFKQSGGIGIVHASTGHDNVPYTVCENLGLKQSWLDGYSTPSVVEFGLLLTLLVARTQKLPSKTPLAHKFCFKQGMELNGKVAVVIGSLGRIGSGLIPVLESLGMLVLTYDSKPGHGFSELQLKKDLGDANFIYLCINGENNNGFFSKELLRCCKKKPVLINLVRKQLINEKNLMAAINQKWISYYVIDETVHSRFDNTCNVFFTNHQGANTVEARERQKARVSKLVNKMFGDNLK